LAVLALGSYVYGWPFFMTLIVFLFLLGAISAMFGKG
jgi:hypothetical protein